MDIKQGTLGISLWWHLKWLSWLNNKESGDGAKALPFPGEVPLPASFVGCLQRHFSFSASSGTRGGPLSS